LHSGRAKIAPFTGCRPANQGSEGHLPYSATSLLLKAWQIK